MQPSRRSASCCGQRAPAAPSLRPRTPGACLSRIRARDSVTGVPSGIDNEPGAEPLRVLVVGADADRRRRLAERLAGVEGIQVVGWLESSEVLEVLSYDDGLAIVSAEPAVRRPKLSPRQRDVLVAYAAGNELMPAVARSLGMD